MCVAEVEVQTSASAGAFYDAWLDEAAIREWLGDALRGMEFGLSGEVVKVETNTQVGGEFFYSDMREGEKTPHWGTYLELERPERIVFTWFPEPEQPKKSVVTLDIESNSDGSLVKVHHELLPEWSEFVGQTEIGWASTVRACGNYAVSKHEGN